MFMLLEKALGTSKVLLRYIDFACALYKINELAVDNQMLTIRLQYLRDTVMKLLLHVSKYKGSQSAKILYVLSCLNYILKNFHEDSSVSQNDLHFFERELAQYQEKYIGFSLKTHFGELVEFVENYARKEMQSEFRSHMDSPP